MRDLLLILFLTVVSLSVRANPTVMQLLEMNHYSLSELQAQGKEVIMGELTGAGSQMQVEHLDLVITDFQVIEANLIDLVFSQGKIFRPVPSKIRINSIQSFEALGQSIRSQDVRGIVIKRK